MRSLLVLAVLIASAFAKSKNLVSLHEENWTAIMKGEWMVEFHAPWCPACKDLQKAWNSFADYSRELGINVAEVDVTVNPGLSGRFLVTALPTIYHVKDGVFRVYSGPRDKHDFIEFIEERKWSTVTPVPDYKHPNSHQMAVVAVFFKLSMSVRDLHNHLVEVKGIPAAASYALFAGVTLALGCVLGFLIVLVIDQVFPTGAAKAAKKAEQNKKKENNKKKEAEKKKEQEKAQNSATEDSADETKDDKVRNRKTENQNNNQKKEKETPKTEGKKVK